MSSNIRIQRICLHCNKEFTAKTTVTKYCSDRCAKWAYKARQKTEKIEESNKETRQIVSMPFDVIQAKEYLTVLDAAKLLTCSRQTIYSLINAGRIKATNIKVKKTLIKRTEIDRLF